MITDKEDKIIKIITEKYNLNYNETFNMVSEELLNQSIENMSIDEPKPPPNTPEIPTTPIKLMVQIIHKTAEKEKENDLWTNSQFKNLPQLQSNNVGKVGENFIESICKTQNIESSIDGTKTKEKGGGTGDGKIKNKDIEIKTAHIGNNASSFQHELGEYPWKADYMLFVDIDPDVVYLTIFENFTEKQYRDCIPCAPYFPSRSFCHRKKSGAFKFDTTKKLNEIAESNNYTIKITESTTFDDLCQFINIAAISILNPLHFKKIILLFEKSEYYKPSW